MNGNGNGDGNGDGNGYGDGNPPRCLTYDTMADPVPALMLVSQCLVGGAPCDG